MEMPRTAPLPLSTRADMNLSEHLLASSPEVMGRSITYADVQEVVELLSVTTRHPKRVVSKGQAMVLNDQLAARLGFANKRINELSATLESEILTIDAEGTMRCRVSPETVLPVLKKFVEELEGVVAANAQAAAAPAVVSEEASNG